MDWQRIETAPKTPYEEILVAATRYEEDGYVHRIAMWDPEIDDWTVFMANWDAKPMWWMPLPTLPEFEPLVQHASDCATNNGPALPVGECDCQ